MYVLFFNVLVFQNVQLNVCFEKNYSCGLRWCSMRTVSKFERLQFFTFRRTIFATGVNSCWPESQRTIRTSPVDPCERRSRRSRRCRCAVAPSSPVSFLPPNSDVRPRPCTQTAGGRRRWPRSRVLTRSSVNFEKFYFLTIGFWSTKKKPDSYFARSIRDLFVYGMYNGQLPKRPEWGGHSGIGDNSWSTNTHTLLFVFTQRRWR